MRAIVILAVLASACAPPPVRADRAAILDDLEANVIVPTYVDLADRTGELDAAIDALCAAPSIDALHAARDAWRATREPLRASWVVAIGPAIDENLQREIDFGPVQPDAVEAAIASGTDPSELGAQTRGFPAIEYLLFDPARDDATVLASIGEPTRCAYAASVTAVLVAQTARLRDAWVVDGYGATLDADVTRSFAALFQAVFAGAEAVEVKDIGLPIGLQTMGVLQPDAVVSRFSDASVDDMIAALRAVRAVVAGARGGRDGLGLEDAIAAVRADAIPDVYAKIDAALAALATMPQPFREHLGDPEVETIRQSVQTVVRTLRTDVAALLGVTVTFTDLDGD